MSSAGRAVNSSGFATTLKEQEIGLSGFAVQIQLSSFTGSYGMATAEHREPCESRGSRTVLGARGGEIPPRDSTKAHFALRARAVERAGLSTLNEGQVVEYEEVSNRGKTAAEHLKVQR